MSEVALRMRSERQRWAAPGSGHDTLIATLRINVALILLFGLLFVTFLLLTLGEFGLGTGQIGGYFGLATALVAWYTALAGLLASMPSAFKLPVGPRS